MNDNVRCVKFGCQEGIDLEPFWQYDRGQVLVFEDVPDGAEVQFVHEGSTLNKIVQGGQISIPDLLMDIPGTIKAYVVYVEPDSTTTVKSLTLRIKARVEPSDVVPPEDEPTFREQIEEIMEDAKAAAVASKEAAEEAAGSADNAEQSAQNAETYAASAQQAAQGAEAAATEAAEAAQASASSASNAAAAATSAERSATQAANSANAASSAAIDAAESASKAQEAASSAQEIAQSAKEEVEALVPRIEGIEDDIEDINVELDKKMEKHLLYYNDSAITEDGQALTFQQLYDILMNSEDFAVLVYNNYAYHPNGVSTSQIVFSASYPVNGLDTNHRITMLKNGTITKTDAVDENVVNKTNAITDLNKDSAIKYPTISAVTGYVGEQVDSLNKDIANLSTKKVGYSEVENGKLMMYSDESKAILLAELDLPQGTVEDVQINGTSIVADGVADVPIASSSVFGVSKISNVYGTAMNSQGYLSTAPATNANIDGRNSAYKPVTPDHIPYAVKSAITAPVSATDPAYTEAEQLSARQRLGIDKPWVLKATMTDPDGVTVDLTGCTELLIKGTAEATANVNLITNIAYLVYNAFATSRKGLYGKWIDSQFGIDNVVSKYTSSASAVAFADNSSGYCWINGHHISSIRQIKFSSSSAITSCNLEIYAR